MFTSGSSVVSDGSVYVYTGQKELFLSAYVDDLKMAGKKESLAPMWKLWREQMELDPPKKM